jgi:hypothetical protein
MASSSPSLDFRASQIQVNKIIVSGSNVNSSNALLIYGSGAMGSPLNQGVINSTIFPSSSVGTDVFFYVSGAVGAKGTSEPAISVFGGDLHISGNLTVDGTSPSGGGGTNYFFSTTTDVIETSGALKLSGSLPLRATYLSASVGMEVTGSSFLSALFVSTGATVTGSFINGYGGNAATGTNSHAEGMQTLAGGNAAHSEGNATTSSGDFSHAEGSDTQAQQEGAHSEGSQTIASGFFSHAEGIHSLASGDNSHAEGLITTGSGLGSHAEGLWCVAYGTASHAGGLYTIASGSVDGGYPTVAQTVFGSYNKRGNTTSLFTIGDGSGDSDAARHDILRVEPGSVQISGTLYVSGAADNLPYVIVKGPTNGLSLNVGSTSKNSSINGIGSGYEGFGAGGVDIVSEYGVSLGSSDAPILGVKPTSNGSSFSAILVSPFFLASHGATTVDGNAGYITLNAGEQSVTVTNRCLLSGYSGNSPSIVFVSVATDDATLKSAIGINNRNGTMTIKGNAAATGVVYINFFILGPITSGPIS